MNSHRSTYIGGHAQVNTRVSKRHFETTDAVPDRQHFAEIDVHRLTGLQIRGVEITEHRSVVER